MLHMFCNVAYITYNTLYVTFVMYVTYVHVYIYYICCMACILCYVVQCYICCKMSHTLHYVSYVLLQMLHCYNMSRLCREYIDEHGGFEYNPLLQTLMHEKACLIGHSILALTKMKQGRI